MDLTAFAQSGTGRVVRHLAPVYFAAYSLLFGQEMFSSPCPVAIPPELTELIATKLLSLQNLRPASAMLPESDAELHEWLVSKAEEADDVQFTGLCAAAAIANRKLQASLLPPMLALRPDLWLFAWLAWRMEGDVAEQLLLGMAGARLSGQVWAMSLFVAAAWWLEQRKGELLPPQIVRSAVDLLQFELDELTVGILQALVTHIGKEAGKEILSASKRYRDFNLPNPGRVKALFRSINRPFEEMLSERPTRSFTGGTQRRALDKVGRNMTCRCGSGKKYKNCCEKSDLKRVLDSSTIPGVTQSELEADPHMALDEKRLKKFSRPALLALEPARIPDKLQIAYLFRLSDQKCCDRIVEAFEIWGTPVKRQNVWAHMFQTLKWEWRPDLARRLAKLSPKDTHTLTQPDVRLLLVGDDPAAFLQELEIAAKEVLESGDLEALELLAGTVDASPYRALGVLLMRGHLPLSGDENCQQTYDAILRSRAKLGLGPNDAFSEWMNEKALRKAREHETEVIQQAQDKLARTAEQARRAGEEKQRLERELNLLRKRERTQQEANASNAVDEETQSKIRALMADKKQAQTLARERGDAELEARKALEKLMRENEELKAAVNSTGDFDEEAEEEGREDFSLTERQSPKPIAFPKDFASTLKKFQPHVARAAMLRLGRMAAAEPDAFNFIKKIKALEDVLVLEARVSERYRLLFCLLPKYIRVVGLVYRPELDKFVDHCKRAGQPPVAELQ